MKSKTLKASLFLSLVLALGLPASSQAAQVNLNLDGRLVSMDAKDGLPFNKEGRVLVPLRFITENLGFSVDWDKDSKEVVLLKDQLRIEISTKDRDPIINGKPFVLDVKPLLKDSKTYVPIRFIGEISGKKVNFSRNGSNQTVFISDQEIYISKQPFHHTVQDFKLGKKTVRANVVTVDYKDPRLEIEMALAKDRPNNVEAFESMVQRKKPMLALNGYFFDSYSGKNSTNGHIINNYKTLHYEALPSAFIVDQNDRPLITRPYTFERDGGKIKHAMSVLPQLVDGGRNLALEGEDMSHGKGLVPAQRTAIGIDADSKIKLVTANGLTNSDLAQIMLKLGCVQAGNLDGGASSALYYDGRYLKKPGRKLNSFILFYLN